MATYADIRRVAARLPGATVDDSKRFGVSIPVGAKRKGIAWSWLERVDPRKPRVENRGVLAVMVANVAQRDMMIAAEPAKFFTEPHYQNYPAVLVRLDAVTAGDLETLLAEAYRVVSTPKRKSTRRRG